MRVSARSGVATETFVFFLFLFAGSFFYYTVDYDNTSSRLFAVSAAVDLGVPYLDPYAGLTADKSEGMGHFYSNKAIGASLLAVPVYWALRQFHPWQDSPPLSKGLRYGIRLFTTTLPFAALGATLFHSARLLGASPIHSLWAVLSYGLGSVALIHAGLFSGHGIAAAFSFFSFAGLMSLRGVRRKGALPGFLLGFSAGLAALADYTAVWISVILLAYVFWAPIGRPNKAGFLIGGLLCASLLAFYNWSSFGSLFSFSYAHQVTELFAAGSRKGFLGIGFPDWKAVSSLLGSPSRGLFFIMPVFLFSVEGIRRMVRNTAFRAEGIVILAISVGYLLMIGGFYGWHGGWTFGPRYFVPILPFLAFSLAFSEWRPAPFFLAAAVSVIQVQTVALSLPHCPEAIRNPLPELIVPAIREGYLAETWPGWLGLPRLWSMLLYFGVAAFLSLGAWVFTPRLPKPPRPGHVRHGFFSWAVLLWLAAVVSMVWLVRTDPPQQVTLYQERLLLHRSNAEAVQRCVEELADRYRRSEGGGGAIPGGRP